MGWWWVGGRWVGVKSGRHSVKREVYGVITFFAKWQTKPFGGYWRWWGDEGVMDFGMRRRHRTLRKIDGQKRRERKRGGCHKRKEEVRGSMGDQQEMIGDDCRSVGGEGR